MIAGIILAAGASSRMGSPKALLDYQGETFISRLVRVLSTVCDPVIVVLGYHAEQIAHEIGTKAHIVVNPAPERGQLSSLQTGLAAASPGAEGILFLPVDCPTVAEGTVQRLALRFSQRQPEVQFVIPQFEGKHGHPVCFVRKLGDDILALPPTGQARDVVHAHIAHTEYIDVDDPGILRDVDDPEAYRKILRPIP